MTKAFVLLSGGIDSTTCLYHAAEYYEEVYAVSIDYGQRHRKEFEFAKRSCDVFEIPHYVIPVPRIPSALTDANADIPNKDYSEIEGVSPAYVPFRNGLMLSVLTSWAHAYLKSKGDMSNDNLVYFGAHAEDARNWAYPDCTPEFIGAMANAIRVGSYNQLRLYTPLEWLTKPEIIKLGEELGVDWANTWSCYMGEEIHCGVCPTCRSRRTGFIRAGIKDPTPYKLEVETR